MELMTGIPVGDNSLTINLWVTSECNFNCAYCYEGDKKSCFYLDEECADKVVDFINTKCEEKSIDLIWLNFHGGEPLLNSKMIRYVVDKINATGVIKRLFTTTTTNCSIYDETITDYICQLTVSIDGTKKVHDLNRVDRGGNPTYDRCIANALKYLDKAPNLRLRTVVTPNNVEYLFESVKELIELGFPLIVPGVDYYSDAWTDELFDVYYEQLKMVKSYLKEKGLSEDIIGGFEKNYREMTPCKACCSGFQIDADGKLYSCTYVVREPEYCIGDIEKGFDEEKIAQLNKIGDGCVEDCKDCGFSKYCVTNRCLLLNKQLTGSYYIASPVVCAYENMILRLKGLV